MTQVSCRVNAAALSSCRAAGHQDPAPRYQLPGAASAPPGHAGCAPSSQVPGSVPLPAVPVPVWRLPSCILRGRRPAALPPHSSAHSQPLSLSAPLDCVHCRVPASRFKCVRAGDSLSCAALSQMPGRKRAIESF